MENKKQLSAPRKGTIKFINVKARFGFIIDQETREEFYFKMGDWASKDTETKGIVYNFETAERKRGLQAINIRKQEE